MDNFNMNSINEALSSITSEKDNMVILSYNKDKMNNTNNNHQILYCLKRLGYYNIDINRDYNSYNIENRLRRSVELSKFIICNDTYNFYTALTLEELKYLNYCFF
jgi:hypothetical protein